MVSNLLEAKKSRGKARLAPHSPRCRDRDAALLAALEMIDATAAGNNRAAYRCIHSRSAVTPDRHNAQGRPIK